VPSNTTAIAQNLARVRERIAKACERSGRNGSEIKLVAISKTFPPEAILAAYAEGQRHFGENRVQEWEAKSKELADLNANWHFIGHLQSNKARRAAQLFTQVDSVDSLALAQRLDASVEQSQKRLPVLIEVRLSAEETKTGVKEANLEQLARSILLLPHLELRGLMTIPPYYEDPEKVRPYFRKLRELRDFLSEKCSQSLPIPLPALSMGMSHDFEVAIEEGATEIRVGTAIFGDRDNPNEPLNNH
jgi:pyridoxal phosphate enzyme (YggS family)